ncbi:nitroreductase family protein [Streptomyces sp. MAR4 CNX-425]|uniref:nitroreductase family protein n=1 Tax=Streptomyces sp. MAR4 CNX-425 TaxID=3406343 RepID=UPI003B5078C9
MPLIEESDLERSVEELLRTRTPLPPVPPGTLFGAGADEPERDSRQRLPLESVLRGRKTVRAFTAAPIELGTLRHLLIRAERGYRARRLPYPDGPAPVSALVGMRRVTDVTPGLYNLAAAGGTEEFERLSHTPAPPSHWAETFTDAPAYVFIGGPVATTAGGTYGALLTHAGALGLAVWHAARAYGLDCCAYGAADFRLGQIMRSRDPAMRHMFTVVIGHPPETGPADWRLG